MAGISDEKYEELRKILEKRNGRTYTLEDAKEIGDGLIAFYAILQELDVSITERDGGSFRSLMTG